MGEAEGGALHPGQPCLLTAVDCPVSRCWMLIGAGHGRRHPSRPNPGSWDMSPGWASLSWTWYRIDSMISRLSSESSRSIVSECEGSCTKFTCSVGSFSRSNNVVSPVA